MKKNQKQILESNWKKQSKFNLLGDDVMSVVSNFWSALWGVSFGVDILFQKSGAG